MGIFRKTEVKTVVLDEIFKKRYSYFSGGLVVAKNSENRRTAEDFNVETPQNGKFSVLQDLQVTEHNLDKCVEEQAELTAWYGFLLAKKRAEVKQAKLDFDVWLSEKDEQVRIVLAEVGEKVTEKLIERKIVSAPEYIKRQKRIIVLEKEQSLFESTCEALRHKKDMLGILASERRAELYGSVRVAEERLEKRTKMRNE